MAVNRLFSVPALDKAQQKKEKTKTTDLSNQNTLPPLPGFKRLEMTRENEVLFSELYAKQEYVLYNHSLPIPFTYLNLGSMQCFINEDATPDNIIPIVQKYKTNPRFFIHCPNCNIDKLMGIVEQLQALTSYPVKICDVTEEFKKKFIGETKGWKAVTSSKDAIFDTNKITELAGGEYRSIRKGILKFKRMFPNHRVEPISKDNMEDALLVFDKWKKSQGLKYFRIALGRDINLVKFYADKIDNWNYFGYLVYVENEPAALTVAVRSTKNHEWAIHSTLKGIYEYEGIAPFLNHYVIEDMNSKGIKYTNDSGLYGPGIKLNKMKWKPVDFLVQYDIIQDKK